MFHVKHGKGYEMQEYTVRELIDYFYKILKNGGVDGTDFELTEEEKEIYRTTIKCLMSLKYL